MKKIALFSMVALTLLFSQCKKNDVKPAATDEGIFISLNADYNGAKTGFDPTTGNFVWSNTTEYVNVGGSVHGYLGQLSGTGDGSSQTITFSGNIITPDPNETLYFVYLGNGDHAYESYLNFSNQEGTMDGVTNYHIAVGSVVYTGSTEFSATLEMKAAFARIDMSAFSGETVYVHGDEIYAIAYVDYYTGEIRGYMKGYINIATTVSNDRFVALIPSTTSETTVKFDSNSTSGSMTFQNGIKAGSFYAANNQGDPLTFTSTQTESCKGLFTVDKDQTNWYFTKKMVRFSPGNLQYKQGDGYRFAEHQYDFVGAWNTSEWVDLLRWGSGNKPLGGGIINYGAFYDWGEYCGDPTGNKYTWYTMNMSEWESLLWWRPEEFLGFATVNGIKGMVLLPDDWTLPDGITFNFGYVAYNSNIYTIAQWLQMESAGAVFLPAAGIREGTVVTNDDEGYYWSSDMDDYQDITYFGIIISNENVDEAEGGKPSGWSVRLVCDVD